MRVLISLFFVFLGGLSSARAQDYLFVDGLEDPKFLVTTFTGPTQDIITDQLFYNDTYEMLFDNQSNQSVDIDAMTLHVLLPNSQLPNLFLDTVTHRVSADGSQVLDQIVPSVERGECAQFLPCYFLSFNNDTNDVLVVPAGETVRIRISATAYMPLGLPPNRSFIFSWKLPSPHAIKAFYSGSEVPVTVGGNPTFGWGLRLST